MSRPITRREVEFKIADGTHANVVMTTRQEELFQILREADGRVVLQSTLVAKMNISKGALRVLKCELSKLVREFYSIHSVVGGGYQMVLL